MTATAPNTPERCNKIHDTLFGNGNPGIVERTETLEDTLIGDTNHDGALTLLRQIDERTQKTEDYRLKLEEEEKGRPKNRMKWIKDYASLINILFIIVLGLYTILGG